MRINRRLITDSEAKELKYVGIRRIRLQYLKDSKKKMGIALWNVLEPRINGYNYGPDSGVPTFSVQSLREKGLI